MKYALAALVATGILSNALYAQETGWSETRFHRVYLRNGNFVDGHLLQDQNNWIILKVPTGELGVAKHDIERDSTGRLHVEFIKIRSYKEPAPIVEIKKAEPVGAKTEEIVNADMTKAAVPKKTRKDAAPGTLPALLNELGESENKAEVVKSIMAFGKEGRLTLAESLHDFDESSVVNALNALVQAKDTDTLPALRAALSDENPVVRGNVAKALGTMGDGSDLRRIQALLSDPDPRARIGAISALGKLKDEESFSAIAKSLVSSDAPLRQVALDTLTLLANEYNRKDDLRRAMVDALEQTQGETRSDLIRLAGKSKDKEFVDPLARLLSERDPETRAFVIAALSDLDARDMKDQLVQLVDVEREYWPRIQLAQAVERMKATAAIASLIEWLRDSDDNIRIAAARALKGLSGQNLGVSYQAWSDWWSVAKR
jgi:HEAT repeat protein